MIRILHPLAGTAALVTILGFFGATVLAEAFGDRETVIAVKTALPWGFFVLLPALAATGASGMALGRGRRGGLVARKRRRMAFVAANGLLVLVPSAAFLAWKAGAGQIDAAFVAAQVLELVAGAANIALLGLSLRDGLRLSGRLRPRGKA